MRMSHEINRRDFLRTTGVGAGLLSVACQPAAGPANPSQQATAGAESPAKRPAWEDDWEKMLAAAKQEGTVVVLSNFPGPGYRRAIEGFQAAFPGIALEFSAMTSAVYQPKMVAERQAGVYAWDVAINPATSTLAAGGVGALGFLQPLDNVIIRGDVTDDAAWFDGYNAGFGDSHRWGYYFEYLGARMFFWINTDMVGPDEVHSVKDLLNPKWKGRMLLADPRSSGYGFTPFTIIRLSLKDDSIVRQVYVDQAPAISRDTRQIAESMVRGRYAIATGFFESDLAEFKSQGLAGNLKTIPLNECLAGNMGTGIYLIDRAPHPNAAKVFMNWFLSKDAQAGWAVGAITNSRRKDVSPGDLSTYPQPDQKYSIGLRVGTEAFSRETDRTRAIAMEALK